MRIMLVYNSKCTRASLKKALNKGGLSSIKICRLQNNNYVCVSLFVKEYTTATISTSLKSKHHARHQSNL